MRQFIVQGTLAQGALGSFSLGDAATTCAIDAYNNNSLSTTIQGCGGALLESDPSLSQSISTVFETILNDAWNEAKQGTAVALSVYGAIEVFVSFAGSDALTDILFAIVNDLASYIFGTVSAVAVGAGFTAAAGTGIAAGASSFGYVGAVIGFIIGATIAIADYANPHSVQLTYGIVVSSKDYVATNLVNAGKFIQNYPPNADPKNKSTAGLTPQYVATMCELFLANPTWLWANQAITGMCQPIPPEQGSGSAVDFVFTQCPGAFELLSRAQFAEACVLLSLSPSKLGFYMSVAKPISGSSPTENPTNNPNNYNPIWSQADLYGAQAWTPDNPASDAPFTQAGIINPDTDAANWSWPAANPNVNSVTVNATACTPSGSPAIQDDTEVNPTSSNPAFGGRGYAAYFYSSCPNLVTNNNYADANGNITGQTDIAPGIYNLQIIYPALTTNQCLCIFNANFQAYLTWVAKARAWAMARCKYPATYELGTGSPWNLEINDVHSIQGGWYPPPGCPAHKGAAKSTSTTTTSVLKTTAAVAGLGAIGVAWYASRNGLTVTKAATSLFGKAVQVSKGLVRRIT